MGFIACLATQPPPDVLPVLNAVSKLDLSGGALLRCELAPAWMTSAKPRGTSCPMQRCLGCTAKFRSSSFFPRLTWRQTCTESPELKTFFLCPISGSACSSPLCRFARCEFPADRLESARWLCYAVRFLLPSSLFAQPPALPHAPWRTFPGCLTARDLDRWGLAPAADRDGLFWPHRLPRLGRLRAAVLAGELFAVFNTGAAVTIFCIGYRQSGNRASHWRVAGARSADVCESGNPADAETGSECAAGIGPVSIAGSNTQLLVCSGLCRSWAALSYSDAEIAYDTAFFLPLSVIPARVGRRHATSWMPGKCFKIRLRWSRWLSNSV